MSETPRHGPSAPPTALPIYVDLDGTLTRADTLWESWAQGLRDKPFSAVLTLAAGLASAMIGGNAARARFKATLAERFPLTRPESLPRNEELIAWLRQEKAQGRTVILATAADARTAAAATHGLDLFDDMLASRDGINLKGAAKRDAITRDAAARGAAGFAYAGNDRADLPIWQAAGEVIVAWPSAAFGQRVQHENAGKPLRVFGKAQDDLRDWLRLVRIHQWAKNLLLFLPLLAAHITTAAPWLTALMGFVAFGLVASATYLVNDLHDLTSDRIHPRKRRRPLAAGSIGIPQAITATLLLGAAGAVMAALVSPLFLGILGLYTLTTLSYSAVLKRKSFIDVLTLAGLYTLRIFAGAVAAGIAVSNWLLALSIFLFLSLALVKRCAELEDLSRAGEISVAGRGYEVQDLPYLRVMGIASGFMAVLVLALYIDRPQVAELYGEPQLLWLALPVVLAWIMRLWLETSRGRMHDDPLVYALRDPFSWVVGASILGIGIAATVSR